MSSEKYLKEMKMIHDNILSIIRNEEDNKENFQKLTQLFDEHKIRDNKHKIRSFLYLIANISNNHHHTQDFFNKIDQILTLFQDEIKNNFSKPEIFGIFRRSKRILLFLTEQNIIEFDDNVISKLSDTKYEKYNFNDYFYPEMNRSSEKMPEEFYAKRKIGENDSHICQLIREDLVKEFIIFLSEHNISVNSEIKPSKYETNNFLLDKETSLIEYAAFFGSLQILKYLYANDVPLMPSIWLYAIHSNSGEMIHFLEENHVNLPCECAIEEEENMYDECIQESIKCHHNEIMEYFQNFYKNYDEFSNTHIRLTLKYYNFELLQSYLYDQSHFYYLCKYDHCFFVENVLSEDNNINVNEMKILIFCLINSVFTWILTEFYFFIF